MRPQLTSESGNKNKKVGGSEKVTKTTRLSGSKMARLSLPVYAKKRKEKDIYLIGQI
jgi:hypothetical protein